MYKKLISCLLFCTILIVTGCVNVPNEAANVSEVKLVDTISDGKSFRFRGLDWFITYHELKQQENISQEDIVIRPTPPMTFKYKKSMTFREVDLHVDFILYSFNDEPSMFVSGHYIATFENEDEYLATVVKVKSELEAEFSNMNMYFGNHFNPLEDHSSIQWEAEDSSRLTLQVFKNNGSTPYTINIAVHAPLSF